MTKEINILEHKKYDELADAAIILSLEKQTSKRYLFLAKILYGHPKLEQECILTAFSMNPTHECFELVCELAMRQQKAACEGGSNGNAPSQNESIDALHSITSADLLLNSKDYDALRAPNHLLDSLTGLSQGVRSDLVCLLTMPRIKNLNWLVPWPDLKKECEELLIAEKKKQIVENTTAAANDKLKYINLNYDDYKDFTPHEYPGIEMGYEIYIADSDSSEPIAYRNGSADEGDSTDTAPESKQFIVKEARRIKERKRRLIRRSQKLLEQSENDIIKIKDEPDESDQAKNKKKRKRTVVHVDSLKPRIYRRAAVKKQKSGEENATTAGESSMINNMDNINQSSGAGEMLMEVKTEPIDIKEEPIDTFEPMQYDIQSVEPVVDVKIHCDEDTGRTFTDLSNVQQLNIIQQFNGGNFPLNNTIIDVAAGNECDFTEMGKENSFDQASDMIAQPSTDDAMVFGHLPHETSNQYIDQSNADSTTLENTALVSSIIFTEPKNEPVTPTFHSICDGNFDDEKIGIQFQNFVGNVNEIFNLNATELSYFTNETINLTPTVAESPPIIQELCPLDQSSSIECDRFAIPLCNGNSQFDRQFEEPMPYALNNATPPVSIIQSSKPKNPLLAFRKPKKCTIKPNDGAADTSNGPINEFTATTTITPTPTISPLDTNSSNTFSFPTNSIVTNAEQTQSSQHCNQMNYEFDAKMLLPEYQNDIHQSNALIDLANDQVNAFHIYSKQNCEC